MNKTNITKKYYINGPESVFRLEGIINGINKIIYIFGEYHSEYTECEDYNNSIDIDRFFIKIFKKNLIKDKNKIFDFFVEMYNEDRNMDLKIKYSMHIAKIRKLVTYNTKIINDKVQINKDLSNIRSHFFDIRIIFEKYGLDLNDIEKLLYKYCNYDNIDKLNYLIQQLDIFKKRIVYFIFGENIFDKDLNIIISNIINKNLLKILDKYNNKDIQEIIKTLFIKYMKNFIIIIDNIDKFKISILKILDEINIKDFTKLKSNEYYDYINIINYNIKVNIENILDLYTTTKACITDLYLIRRILDKDYINNIIIYSGDLHNRHIRSILLKYFNFEITHCNINYKDFDMLKHIENENEIIKKYDDILDIEYQLTILSNRLSINSDIKQCINLFEFPDNLS